MAEGKVVRKIGVRVRDKNSISKTREVNQIKKMRGEVEREN